MLKYLALFFFFSLKDSIQNMLVIQFVSINTTNTIGNTIENKQIQATTLANTIDYPINTFGNTMEIVLLG